jgi:glycosyltransferase involved in cell wall biosynthesis
MAGMGIRAFEMARALAADFSVRLLSPGDPADAPPAPGVELHDAPPGSLSFAGLAGEADAALVSGHAANAFFSAAPSVPVAVDLYDPYLIENFQYLDSLGASVEENDRRALSLALARGDFFLCASEEQRLFYSGVLLQAGRLDASLCGEDPTLSSLLAIVPFGTSDPGVGDPEQILRAVGARPGNPVLYFGGLYDWHDTAPLFEAWPGLLSRFPDLKLIFAENPNPDTTPQRVFVSAASEATRRGWKDRSIFFLPWAPYERRADIYAASTLAVCTCRRGIETDLSFRTRLLDAAAAGVPSVSLEGGAVARVLEEAGAGFRVRDAAGLEEQVARLLTDMARRGAASERARTFASRFSWPSVVRPLAEFLERARVSRRLPFPEEAARRPFLRLKRGGS